MGCVKRGEDVGDVSAVEDGLECWQDRDGDGGAVLGRDESGGVECEDPGGNRVEREEELGSEWYKEEEDVEEGNAEFEWEAGDFHDGDPEGG